MARRKKTLSRLTRAKNLLAKVVTNRAAGLVLPVVSKTIPIQVQEHEDGTAGCISVARSPRKVGICALDRYQAEVV
jgi:hypothetical protein